MSKASIIVRLIVWSLVAVILSSLLVFSLVFDGSLSFIGIPGSYRYKNAEKYSSGDLDISDYKDIKEIEIDWEKGSVDIALSDRNKLTVSEEGASGDNDSMRWLVDEGKLTVRFSKSGFFLFGVRPKKDLTVRIPKKLMEELKFLEVDSVSADCTVKDVSAKEIKIDAVSAKLNASGIVCDKLEIDSVSGDVDVSGEIKEFDCDSVSGRATLTVSKAPEKINCDSVSGDVTLVFGECEGFTVNFDKISGNFSSDFPTTESDGKRVYGDGSTKINVDAISGKLQIKKAD